MFFKTTHSPCCDLLFCLANENSLNCISGLVLLFYNPKDLVVLGAIFSEKNFRDVFRLIVHICTYRVNGSFDLLF